MNVVLLGYGKMGKTIERIALERGHTITARIDVDNQHEFNGVKGDVAIEFSHPDAAFDNIRKALLKKLPVVCGTTGWLHRKKEIEHLCKEQNGAFFYASNFSLGVNLFFKLNEHLARIMNSFPEYDVQMDEVHHTQKKDAPSGTAITLAEGVLRQMDRKKRWVSEEGTSEEELVIKSFRIADIPGTHVVKYSSPIDDIELKHTAHSREGFALGAVMVAEWLKGRTGILTMDDFLKF